MSDDMPDDSAPLRGFVLPNIEHRVAALMSGDEVVATTVAVMWRGPWYRRFGRWLLRRPPRSENREPITFPPMTKDTVVTHAIIGDMVVPLGQQDDA